MSIAIKVLFIFAFGYLAGCRGEDRRSIGERSTPTTGGVQSGAASPAPSREAP